MNVYRLVLRMSLFAAAGCVSATGAQTRYPGGERMGADVTLFDWSGQVNREVELVMQGNSVSSRPATGEYLRERVTVRSSVPRDNGVVSVQVYEGSGTVQIVQQPSQRNNYTTVVHVVDNRSGTNSYRFSVRWTPTGNGGYGNGDYGNGGYGSGGYGNGGYGRGNDDCYDDYRYGNGRYGRGNDDWGRGNNGNGVGRGRGRGRSNQNDCDDYGNGTALHGALRWTGGIDAATELRIRGRQVSATALRGAPVRNASFEFTGGRGLPLQPVTLRLRNPVSRGNVQIVQQPSARNNYTAIVRILDPQAGYGRYDLQMYW